MPTTSDLYILLALLGSYALGRYHGRFRVAQFQNRGEALVSRAIQAGCASPDYHLLNHITLKLKDGTTQIDHILLSRYGVFVIETKDYSGWIFANDKQATWTQVHFRKKFKFQNPIFQNSRHIRAVQSSLDFLPPSAIQSLVVFTGDAQFKTPMPPGVFTVATLMAHLNSHKQEIISENRMQFCVGKLETSRLAISGQTDLEHLESLKRRHSGKN